MKKHIFFMAMAMMLYDISGYGQFCSCTNDSGCSISASIPYNGDTAKGDYSIFYGNTSNQLINPIIVVEGLDINNTFFCQDFASSGIPSTLNAYGYDVVFLNLHNNLDYVERNAFLVVELIKEINHSKVGNNQLIVAGINTGAVEARYALSYMEANGMDHQTMCYLSIDGAQRGMNIPLSFQMWLQQEAIDGLLIGLSDAFIEDQHLQQPIFNELLYCNPSASNANGFPSPSNSYINFFNNLRSLTPCYGYPQKCKKIAISGGAIDGSNQVRTDGVTPATPFDLFFSYWNYGGVNFPIGANPSSLASVAGWIYADPDTSYERVMLSPGQLPGTVYAADFLGTLEWGLPEIDSFRNYDVSPGSYSEYISDAETEVAAYVPNVTVTTLNTTFIPTISAFDINTENFYFDFGSNWPVEGIISPFDKCYAIGGNNDANYLYLGNLFSSTDILVQIQNAGSYLDCNLTADFAIPLTTIGPGNSQNWEVSQYLTADSLTVDSLGSATLIAGNAVNISPGIKFDIGSVATIQVKPCTPNVCTPPEEKIGRINSNGNPSAPPVINPPKSNNTSFELYPNPSNSVLNVKLPIPPDNNAQILIYNDEGIMVMQTGAGQAQIQISVSNLTDGVYLLIFRSNSTYASKQFTVAKF